MRHLILLLTAFVCSCYYADGSNIIFPDTAKVVAKVPDTFLELRISNDSVSRNSLLNEKIIDLVNVDERDKRTPTPYTTHQGGIIGGWIIRSLGFYWKAVDRKRHKFVGTNRNGLSLPGKKDELTEHDVNFNLIPHLPTYLSLVYDGSIVQSKRRQFKRADNTDITIPPYITPTEETAEAYELHCELTPPKRMRDSLNALFYPCMHGCNLDQHPNFFDMKPTVGMYGIFVLDCNHSCHPEIHPYEWLWWLRFTEKEKAPGNFNKDWMIGFFKESSNRFIHWTFPPRVGTISVPFIFKTSETKSYLKLNEIVKGKFRPKGIKRMDGLPQQTSQFNFTDTIIPIVLTNGKSFPLQLKTNQVTNSAALKWWLSDLQTDEANEWVWGYFNMVVSVKDGYTARLESVTAE